MSTTSRGTILLRTLLALVLLALTLPQPRAAAEPDAARVKAITEHVAERHPRMAVLKTIGPGRIPFAHTITWKKLPSDRVEFSKYGYTLLIDESEQEIYLGSTYHSGTPDFPGHSIGFNRDSVALRWLAPNQLLHIRWQTIGQGSGGHRAQGNLLLHREGSSWNEVFRDWRHASSKINLTNYTKTRLSFEWDGSTSRILLRESIYLEHGGKENSLGPLSWTWNIRPEVLYFTQRLLFVSEWNGAIQDGELSFDPGKQYLSQTFSDFDNRRVISVKDIALYLTQSEFAKAGPSSASEWEDRLQNLNSELGKDGVPSERLVIGHPIPPFAPNKDEMLRSGVN